MKALHDHYCEDCKYEFEEFVEWDVRTHPCFICGKPAKRVYKSFKGIKHDAPEWMKSVVDVVDKEGGAHCQEFIKSQTRENYNSWMKGEGLRPLEPGEESVKRKKVDTTPLRKKVKESFRDRNTIKIRSQA